MSDERTTSDVVPAEGGGDRSLVGRIDQMIGHFEAAWRTGRSPRIEAYLAGFEPSEQPGVLRILLRLEMDYRRQLREKPQAADYRARFPQFSAVLDEVFQTGEMESTVLEKKSGLEDHSPAGPAALHASEEGVVASSPRYVQLEYRASGGLGDIYQAQDEHLKRFVALKFIQDRHLTDRDSRDRFLLEAEITGRLDHPGVVPVYGLGQSSDGRPFYAMRFIEGVTLRQAIDAYHRADWKARGATAQHLELHRLLSHLVAACNTIAYSHNRGVVHRDIKPDNIMIGRYHETLVLDWGLALSVERDERARASGEKTLMPGAAVADSSSLSGAGTIGYMSPEQLPDSFTPVGPASDIYSLGATLYRILAGGTPIQGPPNMETWRRIREGDYCRVREANPRAPKALAAVCEKAMRLRPEDRYTTALELADDLQNYMADEPVSVYREPAFERVMRWARRHRSWTTSLGAAAALVLGVSFLASIVLGRMAQSERDVRLAAASARDQSLRQSSMFAARTIADDIDRAWRILTERADDPELHKVLLAASQAKPLSAESKALQGWLDRSYLDSQIADKSDSWFITDRQGIQRARTPYSKKTIGENFARRDYFHGLGHDLPLGADRAGVEPIHDVRLSITYRSQTDAATRVAYSVPIWEGGDDSPGTQPLGVLAMSVITGQFELLDNAILVDLRPDALSGVERKGLVLQHPRLPDAASTSDWARLPRLSDDWVRSLEQLTDRVLAERSSRHTEKLRLGTLVRSFPDPLEPPGSPLKTASISPVIIESRGARPIKTGWVVIVTEELPLAEAPAEMDGK
jgi:serine/threonine-protein kinase